VQKARANLLHPRRGKLLSIALDMCQQHRQANRRASLCVASAQKNGAHAMSAGFMAYTASILGVKKRVPHRAPLQMHGVTVHDAMVCQQVKHPLNARVATASAMGVKVASVPIQSLESSTMVGNVGTVLTVPRAIAAKIADANRR